MKVHLSQIPPEGLHLEGVEPDDILGATGPGVRLAGPIRYAIDVGLSGSGLFATGCLEAPFELDCVTCLNPFSYTVRVPDFALHTELAGPEMVDLTPQVREDILLALPPHPHCDWGGRGRCPGVWGAQATAAGTAAERPAPWAALDQLKLENND